MQGKWKIFKITLILIVASLLFIDGKIATAASVEAAFAHLTYVMDKYHEKFDVYTDVSAAGNRFVTLGKIFSREDEDKISINLSWKTDCFSGLSCVENRFFSKTNNWGGYYFLNGVLKGEESQPKANWGDFPEAGLEVSGATKLTFWAKGKTGGECVEFFAFGVGRDADTGTPFKSHPDSSPKRSIGYVILTDSWKQYNINLSGADLGYVLGGFGWVTRARRNKNKDIVFYLDEISYDRESLDVPRFLVSYETIPSSLDFDIVNKNTAFTYDNALALIAFISSGKPEHLQRAQLIADALVYAVGNDRFFSDGRLRNAYQGGELFLPPGWSPHGKSNTVRMPGWWDSADDKWYEDSHAVSTLTGDVAWAIIALASYYEIAGGSQYLETAEGLGEFIEAHTKDVRGEGGYTGGYFGWEKTSNNPGGQVKIVAKSTEHNIDIFVAFSRLWKVTGNVMWNERALHARKFLEGMWNNDDGHFWTGTLDDGLTINTCTIPADVNSWGLLALGSPSYYARGITWVENHCYVEEEGYRGFDFNDDRDHIWMEGTAHMALAYQLLGDQRQASLYISELEKAQRDATNSNGKGLVAALHDELTTGFEWKYYNRLHIGATAWFIFAQSAYNPFWGTKIVKGDINGDGETSLYDGILGLQALTGQNSPWIRSDYEYSGADVDGDNTIGLAEVLFIFQKLSHIR